MLTHTHTDTHTHTHTHTHRVIGSQMEQYAEHVPSNSTRLSKRCMDATPYHKHTQIHTHTSAYTAARMHAQIAKQNNTTLSLSLSLTHTHTHGSNFHHLIYLPPQQMQDAEESSATIYVSLWTFFPPSLLFPLHLSSVFSQPSFPLLLSSLLPRCEHSLVNIRWNTEASCHLLGCCFVSSHSRITVNDAGTSGTVWCSLNMPVSTFVLFQEISILAMAHHKCNASIIPFTYFSIWSQFTRKFSPFKHWCTAFSYPSNSTSSLLCVFRFPEYTWSIQLKIHFNLNTFKISMNQQSVKNSSDSMIVFAEIHAEVSMLTS